MELHQHVAAGNTYLGDAKSDEGSNIERSDAQIDRFGILEANSSLRSCLSKNAGSGSIPATVVIPHMRPRGTARRRFSLAAVSCSPAAAVVLKGQAPFMCGATRRAASPISSVAQDRLDIDRIVALPAKSRSTYSLDASSASKSSISPRCD